MKTKPSLWRTILWALGIGLVVHGLLACLQLEPFLRHGIAYKLRWVTAPVDMLPLLLAIVVSGNVHQPSAWGLVAIPLQWIAAGIVWHLVRVMMAKRGTKPK